MPRADPAASPRAAAKHLFRNLHDAHALRKNPLVRHLLPASGTGRDAQRADRDALARVHDLVRRSADRCRDEDAATGDAERAARAHALVVAHGLERRALAEVAGALGISTKHAYRERAVAHERVARELSVRGGVLDPLPEFDEFRYRINRLRFGATPGGRDAAFAASDALVRSVSSPAHRIEVLRVAAMLALAFGDATRAAAAYGDAERIARDALGGEPASARATALAALDLMACELAFERGASDEALASAERAAFRLIETPPAMARTVELHVDSLYEVAAARWNAGRLDDAYASVLRSHALAREARTLAPQLDARVTVGVWRVRNQLLTRGSAWYPAWQRAAALAEALEGALAAGAVTEATDALVSLVQCQALAGNHDEALRAGRFAAFLAAEHASQRMHTHVVIQVAMALLATHHWSHGLALLRDVAPACDVYHAEVAAYVRTERALRSSAFADAWRFATEASQEPRYPALDVRRRVIAADAAHALGRTRAANTLLSGALDAAERLGSTPILRDAYAVAARLTGNARFRRQAQELSRLLTA